MSKSPQQGFIALMSAIIIATILLLVATTGGLTGIFARGDALDAELKARSVAAADACVDQALLALANDPGYTANPNPVFTLNALDKCTILSVVTAGGLSTTTVRATSGVGATPATTNLQVVAKTHDLIILSWREVP